MLFNIYLSVLNSIHYGVIISLGYVIRGIYRLTKQLTIKLVWLFGSVVMD